MTDILFNLLSKIRNLSSNNRNYLYWTAICKDSVLRGHNVLFPNTSIHKCDLDIFTYIQKDSHLFRTKIGKYCSIADNVRTGFGGHPTNMISTFPSFYYNTCNELNYTLYKGEPKFDLFRKPEGNSDQFIVSIGNDVWVGSHVLILDGVTIGDGAVIAAGSVVTKDVEPYAIYGGVPAKLIKYRFPKDIVDVLLHKKWWDKDIEWIKKHVDDFDKVDNILNWER